MQALLLLLLLHAKVFCALLFFISPFPLLHPGRGEIFGEKRMSSRPPSAVQHGPFRTPTPARSALQAQPGHSPLASTPPTALALAEGGAPASGAGCTSTSKALNAWEP
jgi:hypothetical protein